MGLLARLGFAHDVLTADSTAVIPATSGDVAQVSHLPAEVAAAFGINTDSDTVNRTEAMKIPAVRRGRQVIAGTIGTAPMVCMRTRAGNAPERIERPLFRQPDPNYTRASTLTWTVDDMLFNGWSMWRVLARGADRFPSSAERVAPERISVDRAAGQIRIDGRLVDNNDLIRFDGPDEGVLRHGARALRTAIMLEEAVRKFARLDIPLGIFQDETGGLLEDEIKEFLDSWELHRRTRTTGYVPKGWKYDTPAFNAQQLELGAARGFQAQEIARLLNLPASAINAPTNDSLTYATTESNRRELVDMTFGPFIVAIEQRLSMPDCTPLGTEVHLDFSRFIRGDLKDVITTGAAAVTAKLMTADEVRVEWLNLPPLNDTTTEDPNGGNA